MSETGMIAACCVAIVVLVISFVVMQSQRLDIAVLEAELEELRRQRIPRKPKVTRKKKALKVKPEPEKPKSRLDRLIEED